MDPRAFAYFLELHDGLPRQAPGGREHTLKALSLVPDLPLRPRIIDLGCGPGAQSLDLLEAVEGSTVLAVDNLPPMLETLRARAEAAGLLDRLSIVEGDMADLPPSVHPATFHLVWSEGAAYNMGFDAALRAWRHLLMPGGFIALTELTWRVAEDEAPEPARAFFAQEYPGMRAHEANLAGFEAAGFELSGSFFLPASAWLQPYYGPLLERLPAFEAAHADDDVAGLVAKMERREIEVFQEHGDSYGYAFYVGRMR